MDRSPALCPASGPSSWVSSRRSATCGALAPVRLALLLLCLALAWPSAALSQHTSLLAPEGATAERLATC